MPDIVALAVPLQLRLLLAGQEHRARRTGATGDEPVDVRVILAAPPTRIGRRADDAKRTDGGGRLRYDPYRQRNVVVVDVPPLRERRADIVPLARVFAERERPDVVLSAVVEHALETHDWPANVDELERVITRAVGATAGLEVTLDALPMTLGGHDTGDVLPSDLAALGYREMLEASRERVSRAYFTAVLKEAGGNVTQAAVRAGVERESLHRLLKRFGLSAGAFRPK